jgi:hypothetical protein
MRFTIHRLILPVIDKQILLILIAPWAWVIVSDCSHLIWPSLGPITALISTAKKSNGQPCERRRL